MVAGSLGLAVRFIALKPFWNLRSISRPRLECSCYSTHLSQQAVPNQPCDYRKFKGFGPLWAATWWRFDFAFGSNPCNLVSCDQHGKQMIPGLNAGRNVQMKYGFPNFIGV